MTARRQRVKKFLTNTGLLGTADRLLYVATLAKVRGLNSRFVAENPDFVLPPKWLAFDAYSAPNWPFYKSSGEETAAYLAGVAKMYVQPSEPVKVHEWGCGPGRVIRHIPAAFRNAFGSAEVSGSDYNPRTIEWCKKSLPGIEFVLNPLLPNPPLPFAEGTFDFIYSISVFTHLSETASQQWMGELRRISRTGGVLAITTNGDSWQSKMLPEELQAYREKGIVTREGVEEGKKLFSACHSPDYLRSTLFKGMTILSHLPASFPHTRQDTWILRK